MLMYLKLIVSMRLHLHPSIEAKQEAKPLIRFSSPQPPHR